ncbi:MAG TPA: hypothetical protein VFP65_08030, partial [Anaeromyxobacteraceae bacterium]|nr:hypothetical protein [Anaeromyxobacteraceae bacterium]
MKSTRTLLRLTAAALLAVAAVPAHAVLLDHGPADPTLVFPQWYRDLNGLALSECLSKTIDPNPGAGSFPLCFPANPDPAGFAGNVGPEVFYNDLVTKVKGPVVSMNYIAALEGAYLPAGVPIHGTESVFSRIRIIISTNIAGTYKVTHP